jgi:hypothetical protein
VTLLDILPYTIAVYGAAEVATRGAVARRLWHEAMLPFIWLEIYAVKLVRFVYPPRFEIVGECHKRGTCCKSIIGNPPDWVKRGRWLQLFAAYHRVFHNFQVVARGPNDEVIFSCGHLRSDGRCGIYRYRPMLCRTYPVLPWFDAPKVLPGCGYQVAPRVVTAMKPRASLRIINPRVAVHHPARPITDGLHEVGETPKGQTELRITPLHSPEELPEHFEMFDPTGDEKQNQ